MTVSGVSGLPGEVALLHVVKQLTQESDKEHRKNFMEDQNASDLRVKLKIVLGYQNVQFMAVGPAGVHGQRWDTAPKPVDLDNSSMTGQDIAPTQNLSIKGSTAQDELMKKSEDPAIRRIVQWMVDGVPGSRVEDAV